MQRCSVTALMQPNFEQIEQTLASALNGLDARQTQLRPAGRPEKWNIQQIVEHLILTYVSTRSTMESRLAKGTPTLARPGVSQRAMQLVLVGLGIFPNGRPAPSFVSPGENGVAQSGAEILAAVDYQLAEADPVFTQAELLFGDRQAITHQTLGPMSIRQWRKFHLVHARHHAKQILAIRREYGV